MTRLHWTHTRRPAPSAEAGRGTLRATVYLRRDGQWGWWLGRQRTPQTGEDGSTLHQCAPWTRGVARTRRDAQRQCLRWVRAWHRGARVWPKEEP